MDEARIRAATAADVPAIAEIVNEAYRHYIARIGKPPGPMLDNYAARVSEDAYGCSRKDLESPGSLRSCPHRNTCCSTISRLRRSARAGAWAAGSSASRNAKLCRAAIA